jgi:CDP-diacylglycerol---serine O-phosphatidyltransferase
MELRSIDSYRPETVERAEKPEKPGRPRGARRPARRGAYLLPGILTVANLLLGYYAILATLDGSRAALDNAAIAIGCAILFDSLDGRIARTLGVNSDFGKEFDSLADVVSFGIAPAFLAYAWGVRSVPIEELGSAAHIYQQLGWWISSIFVVCCAWRLARFNIHGMAPGGSGYFVGMPTPAAAGMIAAVVHAFETPIQTLKVSLLWLVLLLSLAVLMSSTVRHYSAKNIKWDRERSSRALVLIALAIGLMLFYSRLSLLVLASVYTLHGLVLQGLRIVRHRLVSRPA